MVTEPLGTRMTPTDTSLQFLVPKMGMLELIEKRLQIKKSCHINTFYNLSRPGTNIAKTKEDRSTYSYGLANRLFRGPMTEAWLPGHRGN